MDRANRSLREGGNAEPARAALEEAIRLAPDWEVPRRTLDDLARAELLGPKALRGHWQALEAGDARGLNAYLSGRLNDERSEQRFLEAYRAEPRNPWGLHGLAFVVAANGRFERAIELQGKALALAREPEEQRLFTLSLARYLSGAGRLEDSAATLKTLWDGMEPGANRDGVEVDLVIAEATSGNDAMLARARVRADRLLRAGNLTTQELSALVELGILDSQIVRAWLCLRPATGTSGDWAHELSERLLRAEDPSVLGGRGVFAPQESSTREQCVEWFARGQAAEAWKVWRTALPSELDGALAGRPEIVELERAVIAFAQDTNGAEAAERLAKALLRAGWFEEAQAFVRGLPGGMDVDRALVWEARATLAQQSLRDLQTLMTDVDGGRARMAPLDPMLGETHALTKVQGLDDLLQAVAATLWQAGPFFHGEETRERLESELLASPRLRFGPFAQVVHPGPRFAPWDAQQGRGEEGDPVPGLARVLGRLGRIGIFGSAAGAGAPDASVLRLVVSETTEGEHLGVPFRGTVLWCDGADVGARNVRQGASVAGAALHEGYFVDLQAVRVGLERWQRLVKRFDAAEEPERLERLREILSDPGLPRIAPRLLDRRTEPVKYPDLDKSPKPVDPWCLTDALLGQADRNRLAWMAERARAQGLSPGSLVPPTLEEAVRLTAIHEQGHLCDRTRFLPLEDHAFAALGFLAAQNFSPMRLQERLEYRAQLTAMCEVDDPRLAWIEVLDLAEGSASGLPHGPAYAELLRDLVSELGEGLRKRASWLQGLELDPDHRLVFQLHRVPPEALRAVALRVAAREGLIRN